MIYVPRDTTFNKCYVVQNEDVIRGYDRVPQNNSTYNYRDYYIHSDYIYKDGSGQWSSYSTLPNCLSNDNVSNSYWYRIDLSNIMIIFLVLFVFIVKYPYRLFMRLFGRWLKV